MIEKYKDLISKYIYAKDNSKPHLMKSVFIDTASLDMEVNSKNISFPPQTIGLENITKVLVTNFNQKYENVYTICLEDTICIKENSLDSTWFVLMSLKDTQDIYFGYGSYKWSLDSKNDLLSSLGIVIEDMLLFDKSNYDEIFTWVSKLSYPYTNSSSVLQSMSSLAIFESLKKDFSSYLK